MSEEDLIELQDLNLDNHIELTTPPVTHPSIGNVTKKLRQVQVVKMEGDHIILGAPLSNGRTGEGHHFQPCSHTLLTCCDLCGDFIWGLYKQSLRCTYCRFTCHYRCRAFVQLDCIPLTGQSDFDDAIVEKDTNVDEEIDWRKCELSVSEVLQKVKEYNAQINGKLPMVLNRDGSYSGFVKVHLRLVCSGSVPRSPKQLHISSQTSVREVTQALLSMLGVGQVPRAALYERTHDLGQVRLRRLREVERPLLLRLCAGPSEDSLSLELQEDHLMEINWDAFTLPELDNFLRMLQREEEQRVERIVQRYGRCRLRLQEALERSAAG